MAFSVDSHYVVDAYKYMRSYGLWLHEQLVEANSGLSVISASCDDKCKVMLSSFAIVAMHVFCYYCCRCNYYLFMIYLPLLLFVDDFE